MKLNELQKQLKKDRIEKEEWNIVVISNITFEPYFNLAINSMFSQVDILINILPISYEEYLSDENFAKIHKANYIMICLNFDCLFVNAINDVFSNKLDSELLIDVTKNICKELYNKIKQQSISPIIWFGFEDYCYQFHYVIGNVAVNNNLIDRINHELFRLLEKQDIYIELKRLIASIGIKNAYDNNGKHRWNAPYTKDLIFQMCKEIYKQHLIHTGLSKKCIVLDCDNVLWGGILSEDGVENINLGSNGFGRAYQDFQRFVLSLYYHGIILAVCSKNNLVDVMTMFCEHSEMILKKKHIACFQVNWDNKPANIKCIADTLNIGLDSMVFVDDSPLEIEAVKSMLPEVTAILYERDSVYEWLSCFNLKSNVCIEDIEKRNETYRTNQSREILKSQYDNYNEYIAALEIKTDIHEALPIEYNRIAELTQRTNKCTNSTRYTVAEIKERVTRENVKLYSLSVSDRFSDLGLVGVLEVEGNTLTLFCLSCRALGREIESKLLEFIMDKHQINKIEFKSTAKNEDIKTLLVLNFPKAILTNSETP